MTANKSPLIKTSKRLPDSTDDLILFYKDGAIMRGFYVPAVGFWVDYRAEPIGVPDYWMEIPPLPKEDEDDSE